MRSAKKKADSLDVNFDSELITISDTQNSKAAIFAVDEYSGAIRAAGKR